jgi:hypothetical protein
MGRNNFNDQNGLQIIKNFQFIVCNSASCHFAVFTPHDQSVHYGNVEREIRRNRFQSRPRLIAGVYQLKPGQR